jgi:hypothetical protein
MIVVPGRESLISKQTYNHFNTPDPTSLKDILIEVSHHHTSHDLQSGKKTDQYPRVAQESKMF